MISVRVVSIVFLILTLARTGLAANAGNLQGWQVATSLMFAAETTHIDNCQILVTSLDQRAYADSTKPALITLINANGAGDSVVIDASESLMTAEVSTISSGAARTISNVDGSFEFERNSEIFFIQVGTVQCGKRL